MSVYQFYPYQTAPGRIRLSLSPVDRELPAGPEGAIRVCDTDLAEVVLEASVLVSDRIHEEVLPPSEREAPPLQVVLLCRSSESRRRLAWRLEGDGIYVRTVTLERQDWVGKVEFQAIVVRSRPGSALTSGYASERGALLAWSDPYDLLFDEPEMPPGDFLEVEWRCFEEDPALRPRAAHLFSVDTSGIRPRLILNSGFPGAVSVLDSRGTRGVNARIRDATFFMIAHQVWSSLLATGLTGMSRAADRAVDDPSARSLLEELETWQRGMVEEWAPWLLPEVPRLQALDQLVERISQRDFLDDLLLRRLPAAIQEKLHTYRGFDGLVQELGRG